MHRFLDELGRAAVIQLALNPIELFLLVKPSLRKGSTAKCAAPSLQEVDHRKGVLVRPCVLGGALHGLLGVQAAQEHFQRQCRPLEVLAQQL